MAKYTLDIENDFNFDLFGICSHEGDYRLCWSINAQMGLRLEKSIEPYMVSGKKGNIISSHSFYEWKDEEERVSYYLIKNKNEGKYLIPEKAQIDYFLVIIESGVKDADKFLNELKSLNCVLTAFSFDPYELKSANRILF